MCNELTLHSKDGISHFYRVWTPIGVPKAKILLIHGKGEHGGRYLDFGEYLAKNGFVAYMPDLRGHGNTTNKVGDTGPRDLIFDDINMFLFQMENDFPDIPLFIYGHSMGGNIVLSYRALINNPNVVAYVISSPWLILKKEFPKALVSAVKILAKLAPKFTMSAPIDCSVISSIKQEQELYKKTDKMNCTITLETAADVYKMRDIIFKTANKTTSQVLLIHGGEDPLVDIEGSKKLEALSGKCVKFKVFTGCRHEILHDVGKVDAMNLITAYMNAQI